MSRYNMNDLAHKILQEDLCASYDIVREHMHTLKNIDCHGQTFLEAVFCKAIDEGNVAFCQQSLPHLFCAPSEQRICVGTHAVENNISLEDIKMLLDHDFHSRSDTPEKPLECMKVLTTVAGICAKQKRWDVLEWIVSCLEDNSDVEFFHLWCHQDNPDTFRHAHIPLDAITVVCTALDPLTRACFHWPRTTCDALVAHGLQTIDTVLRTSTLDCDLPILYKLCAYIYRQNTTHVVSYIKQPEVVKAIQNPQNLQHVENLIHLSLFLDTPHAAQLLLDLALTDYTLAHNTVHNMVWRNLPQWISSKHVSQKVATSCLPFAVVYNRKEIGMLLLDIGVNLSHPIDWDKIEEVAVYFYGEKTGGEISRSGWQDRLDRWVVEYEKSVLEIELQSITGADSQRKI